MYYGLLSINPYVRLLNDEDLLETSSENPAISPTTIKYKLSYL